MNDERTAWRVPVQRGMTPAQGPQNRLSLGHEAEGQTKPQSWHPDDIAGDDKDAKSGQQRDEAGAFTGERAPECRRQQPEEAPNRKQSALSKQIEESIVGFKIRSPVGLWPDLNSKLTLALARH